MSKSREYELDCDDCGVNYAFRARQGTQECHACGSARVDVRELLTDGGQDVGSASEVEQPDNLTTSAGNGGVRLSHTGRSLMRLELFCVGCGERIDELDIFPDRAEEHKGAKPVHDRVKCQMLGKEALDNDE